MKDEEGRNKGNTERDKAASGTGGPREASFLLRVIAWYP
jgi:hypothetical protein